MKNGIFKFVQINMKHLLYMLSACFINPFFVYSGLFSVALSVPHILTNHVPRHVLSLKYFEPSAGAEVCLYIFFRIVF